MPAVLRSATKRVNAPTPTRTTPLQAYQIWDYTIIPSDRPVNYEDQVRHLHLDENMVIDTLYNNSLTSAPSVYSASVTLLSSLFVGDSAQLDEVIMHVATSHDLTLLRFHLRSAQLTFLSNGIMSVELSKYIRAIEELGHLGLLNSSTPALAIAAYVIYRM